MVLRRMNYTNYPRLVRDSFLQVIDEKQPEGVWAVAIPDSEMQHPDDRVQGMRIWLSNGRSIVAFFTEEDAWSEDELWEA